MNFAAVRNWLRRAHPAPPGALADALAMEHDPAQAGLAAGPTPRPSAPSPAPSPAVSPARLAIEEELWGNGFLTPGGGAEILRLAAPIGLSAASTLLLLGAQAGGPPQTLAADLGVWVAAFESDPDRAELAARRVQRAGAALAKRASVAAWDPAAPRFRPRLAHHALAIEPFHGADPAPILAAIAGALKPHGQIVLVGTVAPTPLDPADPAIAAWSRLERRPPSLPNPDAITRAFTRLGFDVRVTEDASARHMRLAVAGWRHFVRKMARERSTPERASAIVAEAELWTRRIRLMHAGRIRLMRWHAIGPAEPPHPA